MKCCRVLPVYFGPRRRWIWDCKDEIAAIQCSIEHEIKVDPGKDIELDLIIVNNDPDNKLGSKYLDSVDGKKTKTGKVRVVNGHNIGAQFGAFDFAFETFREDYFYWLFHEDDVIFNIDGYYRKMVDKIIKKENRAFVGFVGLSDSGNHTHGSSGMSNRDCIDKVRAASGSGKLPFPFEVLDNSGFANIDSFIKHGEIAFSKSFQVCGFGLVKPDEKLYSRWYQDHVTLDVEQWGSFYCITNKFFPPMHHEMIHRRGKNKNNCPWCASLQTSSVTEATTDRIKARDEKIKQICKKYKIENISYYLPLPD